MSAAVELNELQDDEKDDSAVTTGIFENSFLKYESSISHT